MSVNVCSNYLYCLFSFDLITHLVSRLSQLFCVYCFSLDLITHLVLRLSQLFCAYCLFSFWLHAEDFELKRKEVI